MIDATLSAQIRKHWAQDKALIPADVGWDGDRFWAVKASELQSDSAAEDLITMAYLKRLYELGKAAMVIGQYEPDLWLAAAVAAYEAVQEKL